METEVGPPDGKFGMASGYPMSKALMVKNSSGDAVYSKRRVRAL
jgi:hypothetical protein